MAQQKFIDSKEAVKKLRDKKGRSMFNTAKEKPGVVIIMLRLPRWSC